MLQPGPPSTKIVCLTQMVDEEELKDDENYADLLEDIKMECGKFGMCILFMRGGGVPFISVYFDLLGL